VVHLGQGLLRHKLLYPVIPGREHSDRRFAPSEHRLRERSPESITTGLAVAMAGGIDRTVWSYGFRNDAGGQLMTAEAGGTP
jgi:hypothetical protein